MGQHMCWFIGNKRLSLAYVIVHGLCLARNEHAIDDPNIVASMVDKSIQNNTERNKLGYFSCRIGNPIDDC